MLHCTRLPRVADARRAALVPSMEEETSIALPSHAENELSAFEASSRRRKATNNKLVALGTGNCCRSPVMSPVLFSVDFDFGFAFLFVQAQRAAGLTDMADGLSLSHLLHPLTHCLLLSLLTAWPGQVTLLLLLYCALAQLRDSSLV